MNTKRLIKSLETRLKAVGEERDKLRELENDVADLKESCSDAYDNLIDAIEALSKLV